MTNLVINKLYTVSGLQLSFPRPSWKMADSRSGIGNVQDELGLYCAQDRKKLLKTMRIV